MPLARSRPITVPRLSLSVAPRDGCGDPPRKLTLSVVVLGLLSVLAVHDGGTAADAHLDTVTLSGGRDWFVINTGDKVPGFTPHSANGNIVGKIV